VVSATSKFFFPIKNVTNNEGTIPISMIKKPEISKISVKSKVPVKNPISINEIPRWMIFFEFILKKCLNPLLKLRCLTILIMAATPEKEKINIAMITGFVKTPIIIATPILAISAIVIDFISKSFQSEQIKTIYYVNWINIHESC